MDHHEEQMMEVEALESIYGIEEGMLEVDRDGPQARLRLRLLPDADEQHVEAVLHVRYTAKYPEELPELKVEASRGLTSAQIDEMDLLARDAAQANLDMAMVFTIAEELKAYLVQHNKKQLSEYEQVLQRAEQRKGGAAQQVDEAPVEEAVSVVKQAQPNKPTTFTPVTAQNFAEWKLAFDAEMKVKREAERMANLDAEKEKRLTGRQFFEQNAARFMDAATAAASESTGNGDGQVLWMDEELYGDDDDLDLSEEEEVTS